MAAADADVSTIGGVERWFVERGTPHLIEQYSASEDVLTRALPTLSLVFLLEFGSALNSHWRWWENVLAAIGGLALLLAIYGAVNRLRGLPALHRPQRVGKTELATFVLVPALVAAAFAQPRQAVGVAVTNLLLLGLVYVVLSYGLVPLTRWAAARVFQQIGEVGGLLSRALPLLLVFVVFLFLTPEVWEVAGAMEWPVLVANLGLFVLLGVVFLLARLPTETAKLGDFESIESLQELCDGTPAAALAARMDAVPEAHPLRLRQRGNLYLVVFVSQTIQIVLVTLTLTGFFVAFGLLAVRPEIQARWADAPNAVEPIVDFDLLGSPAMLTPALLRVAVFLGVFSGFYVAVYAVTDDTYREQFFDRVATELRQTFAVRAAYLQAIGRVLPPT
jgi:hypothetical protein